MDTIEELRERYLELIEGQELCDRVPDGAEVTTFAVDAAEPPSRTSLRTRLTDLFRRQPELLTVVLTTREAPFGVVRRETLRPDEPDSPRETTSAVLMAGPPTRSRARYYACTHEQCQHCADGPCTASEILLFGDGRPPQCPHGHGPMAEEE
jgi:hypothetical protein